MSHTIRIDDDVFAHLQENAKPLVDNPNSVLRRLLGLEAAAANISRAPQANGESPPAASHSDSSSSPVLHAIGPNCNALGREASDGTFYVLEGSLARKRAAPSFPERHAKIRERLLRDGILKEEPHSYKFTRSWSFNSPSEAASVVLGGSADGLRGWKDDQGRTLRTLRKTG